MNKTELVEILTEQAFVKLTKAQWKGAVDSILLMIEDKVKDGEVVRFRGFGNFRKKLRKGREGVHPRTGKPITVPDMYLIKFKSGGSFKRKVK